jgi:hypothetical protein
MCLLSVQTRNKLFMSRYAPFAFLLMLSILAVFPSVGQDDAPLFDTTFEETSLPDGLDIQYGTYDIVDGVLNYEVQNGGFLVIPSGGDWTDYALEVEMEIVAGSVWLQVRTSGDLCSGYYLSISPNQNRIDLSYADADCNFTVLEETTFSTSGAQFVARLDVNGEQIRAYIDDDLILEATDSRVAVGFPIINVFPVDNEAQVRFDTIRALAIDDNEFADEEQVADNESADEEQVADEPVDEQTTNDPTLDIELPNVNEIPLNDDPLQMVASLLELGLIPQASGQFYTGENVSISRIGAWFEPLFDDARAQHAVMSGDIYFLPNSEGENCLLSARIERDDRGIAQRYLDVGINSLDEVFIGETDNDGVYSQAQQEGILTPDGGNILFIVYGNRLSVYVNGRAVFQNIDVTSREGSFGVSANATTSYTLCHVTNIWAYTFND